MLVEKVFNALGDTDVSVFAQDRDFRYRWIYNPRNSWLSKASEGGGDLNLLSHSAYQRLDHEKRRVIEAGRAVRFELADPRGSNVSWYDVRLDADRNDEGDVCGIIGTCIEITEQKRREETLKTLLRELSHRSKNLLAIIQSLASQTARHSVSVPEFLVRFRGRIQSLAGSQDIVTDADWRGADFASLVRTQVERYAPDGMEQVEVDALRVYLSPTASLHIGLALHELAVNAASYGSLTVPGGSVAIKLSADRFEDEDCLVFEWRERNGPRVRSDRDARFGTSTLERIVPNSVGGEAQLDYHPDGVRYRLSIPDTQYEMIASGSGSRA